MEENLKQKMQELIIQQSLNQQEINRQRQIIKELEQEIDHYIHVIKMYLEIQGSFPG